MAEAEVDSKDSPHESPEKSPVPWRTCANCGLNFYKDNPNYSQKWAGHSRNCPSLETVQRNRAAEARLRCNVCRSSFPTQEQLEAHLLSHSTEKRVRKTPTQYDGAADYGKRPAEPDESPRSKRRKSRKPKPSARTDACRLLAVGELVPVSEPTHLHFAAVKQRLGTQLHYLFPVGYDARRVYKDRTYACRILAHADRPQFTVQEVEGSQPLGPLFTGATPSQAVRECIGVNVSGPQFFGLTLPWVHAKIMALPSAKALLAQLRAREPSLGMVLDDNEEDLEDDEAGSQACPYCPATLSTGIGLRCHIERKHPHGEEGGRKKTLHTEEELCGVCQSRDYAFWTSCDQCEGWFHQACVGISPPERDVRSFYCPKCKPRSGASNAVTELQRKVSQVELDNKHLTAEYDNVEGELYKALRELKEERQFSRELEHQLADAVDKAKSLQAELLLYKRTLENLDEIPKSPQELQAKTKASLSSGLNK